MIQALVDEKSLKEMVQILDQMRDKVVLDEVYGVEILFSELLPARQIIYPFEYPETEIILALEAAMKAVQDTGCYVDIYAAWQCTDPSGQTAISPRYCYASLDQFVYAVNEDGFGKEFLNKSGSNPFPIVHLIDWTMYSSEGHWAIHVDSNRFAVLAGTEVFINAFRSNWGSTKLSIEEFLVRWRDGYRHKKDDLEADWNWLTRLMIHVYGREKAFDLMDKLDMFAS